MFTSIGQPDNGMQRARIRVIHFIFDFPAALPMPCVRRPLASTSAVGWLPLHRSKKMRIIAVLFFVVVGSLLTSTGVAQRTNRASTFNKMLEAELIKMGADDQKYRGVIEAEMIKMSATGTGAASDEFIAAVKSQDEIDSRNMARLEEIIKRNGWPGKSLVGEEAGKAAFLILQHSDLTRQEKYLPLLKEAAKKGEARPADVAMLEDRVLVRRGKKQVYGTQVRSGADTGGKLVLEPIEDEEHVDERRASVGLMPLKEYLKHFGIEYKPPTRK